MILSPGDIVADKYRIERFIGEGGMGTVYAAVNQLTGRSVALKWLRLDLSTNETFAQRFMREARVSGRLDHPNIVNVYDVGRHRGMLFLVMELLRGESFDAWLRRAKPTPTDAVARLMPALRAVAAAHAMGVVHRDLKPEHIFLCKGADGSSRETKVLDFGIARDLGSTDSSTSLTNPGSLIGTVHYMAPEQIRNSRHADARSDIYSLGVILYYALGGGLPHDAESMTELILKVASGRAESLGKRNPNIPKRLVDVVMRAMAKDPNKRYQTVAELGRALEPFSGGVPFQDARALSTPPAADEEALPAPPQQTTTMMSAMSALGKRASMPSGKVSSTTLALIGLPAAVFVLVLAGSFAFSRDGARGVASGTSVAATAPPSFPSAEPAPTVTAAVTAPTAPAALPAPSPPAPPAEEASPSRQQTVTTTRPVASPVRARPPKAPPPAHASAAPPPHVATPELPPAAPAPAPAPAANEASPIEKNPYMRH